MSSGAIDGDFHGHPKVVHVWSQCHAALGLWVLGLSHAHKYETGGFVGEAFVNEKLSAKRERENAIVALTSIAPGESGPLWSKVDGGWQIHNFGRSGQLVKTPEDIELLREKRSQAGSKGAAKRWQGDSNLLEGCHDGATAPDDFAIADKKRELLTTLLGREELLFLSDLLFDGMRALDPKAKGDPRSFAWLDPLRLLLDRDGRTQDEIEQVIRWVQADGFWRANILSPGKLRDKFSQLVARMNSTPTHGSVNSERAASDARDLAVLNDLIGDAA